jgi:hypothetical protein
MASFFSIGSDVSAETASLVPWYTNERDMEDLTVKDASDK